MESQIFLLSAFCALMGERRRSITTAKTNLIATLKIDVVCRLLIFFDSKDKRKITKNQNKIDEINGNALSNILTNIGNEILGYNKFNAFHFQETPLILTLPSLPFVDMRSQNTNKLETLFEDSFNINAKYILLCSQALLNLFSHNINSGIVVDIGER